MTALGFEAAINDSKRFTSSTKVGPYLGLKPRTPVWRERMDQRYWQDQRKRCAAPTFHDVS